MLDFKKTLLFCWIFLFTSCSSNQQIISSSYVTAFQLIKDSLIGRNNLYLDKELIGNIPYASLLFNFSKGSQSLLILETKNKNEYKWVSADRKTIIIEDGRVIETFGFPNDLLEIKRPEINFREIIEKNEIDRYVSYYSFRKPDLNNLKVEVEVKNLGLNEVEISEGYKRLILIEEKITSKKINWIKENKYWIDPDDYFVWKSEQSLSPRLPKIFITVTKKPAI